MGDTWLVCVLATGLLQDSGSTESINIEERSSGVVSFCSSEFESLAATRRGRRNGHGRKRTQTDGNGEGTDGNGHACLGGASGPCPWRGWEGAATLTARHEQAERPADVRDRRELDPHRMNTGMP